jgi:hypothetical protein
MRGLPRVLLVVAALGGCGYDESRPLVRSVGIGAGAGAVGGTFLAGPPVGTAIGAMYGAVGGALIGYTIESSQTPAMATLPPQFDGTVAVAPPGKPPPVKDTGYKPFGIY